MIMEEDELLSGRGGGMDAYVRGNHTPHTVNKGALWKQSGENGTGRGW